MPVVRGGDHHAVNVLAGQQFTEIVIGRAAVVLPAGLRRRVVGFDDLLALVAARLVHVAHRQQLHVAVADQPRQMPAPHTPAPDQPQGEPVTRRHRPIGPHADDGMIQAAAAPDRAMNLHRVIFCACVTIHLPWPVAQLPC